MLLGLGSVINYDRKCDAHNLERLSDAVIYNRNMFIIQATGHFRPQICTHKIG
jgi:hypothetical protein